MIVDSGSESSTMRKFFLAAVLSLLFVPAISLAQLSPEDTGLTTTGNEVYGNAPEDIGTFIGANVITPVLGLVGVIFLILMIYGGILWMTGGGNTNQIEKARNIIIAAISGIVIISAAYAITNFIFTSLS